MDNQQQICNGFEEIGNGVVNAMRASVNVRIEILVFVKLEELPEEISLVCKMITEKSFSCQFIRQLQKQQTTGKKINS